MANDDKKGQRKTLRQADSLGEWIIAPIFDWFMALPGQFFRWINAKTKATRLLFALWAGVRWFMVIGLVAVMFAKYIFSEIAVMELVGFYILVASAAGYVFRRDVGLMVRNADFRRYQWPMMWEQYFGSAEVPSLDRVHVFVDGNIDITFKPALEPDATPIGVKCLSMVRYHVENAVRCWELETKRNHAVRIRTSGLNLPKLLPLDASKVAAFDDRIYLGMAESGDNGSDLYWDIGYSPHGLISGSTTFGKSATIRLVLLHAFMSGWDVSLIDPKDYDDYKWAEPFCRQFVASDDLGDVGRMRVVFEDVMAEMSRRRQEIKGHNELNPDSLLESWSQYIDFCRKRGDKVLPKRMIFMIEEAPSLINMLSKKAVSGNKEDAARHKEDAEAIMYAWQNLLRQSRAAGIHLVIAAQTPNVDSVGGGANKNNIVFRLHVGPCGNEVLQRSMEASTASGLITSSNLGDPGRAYVRMAESSRREAVLAQMAWAPQDTLMDSFPELRARRDAFRADRSRMLGGSAVHDFLAGSGSVDIEA